MRRDSGFKALGALAALGGLVALAGCNGFDVRGGDGVPLAELDLTGEAPEAVALLGPDRVTIIEGAPFRITVDGEAAERMRFSLKDGTLGIMRDSTDQGSLGDSTATVRITMPAPRKLVLAGSGRMTSEALARDAEISIVGSGELETAQVDADSLDLTIAGSGTYSAAGRAEALELSVAGSGNARMAGLKVARAEINIAGSGDAAFASDGEVNANIMGSGDVTVRGAARCTVNAMGSGTLTCEREAEPAA